MRACGISLIRYLSYIKQEIFLVLGTSSSENRAAGLIGRKLGVWAAPTPPMGLVVPTGYSFNLDGTNIYMTMAAVFLAQATNTPLDLKHQLGLLLVAMITSRVPAASPAPALSRWPRRWKPYRHPSGVAGLLVGVDRFMSECRALTNFIGNGVATLAISRWEGEVTAAELQAKLGWDSGVLVSSPRSLPSDSPLPSLCSSGSCQRSASASCGVTMLRRSTPSCTTICATAG